MCIKNLFSTRPETIDDKIEKILKQKPKKMIHSNKAIHDIVVFLKDQEDTKIINIDWRHGPMPSDRFMSVYFKYRGEDGLIDTDSQTGRIEKITLGSFILDGRPSLWHINKSEILKYFFEQFNNQ